MIRYCLLLLLIPMVSAKYEIVVKTSGKPVMSMSEAECKAYADSSSYSFEALTTTWGHPKGCYRSGNYVKYATDGNYNCYSGGICIEKEGMSRLSNFILDQGGSVNDMSVSEDECRKYAQAHGVNGILYVNGHPGETNTPKGCYMNTYDRVNYNPYGTYNCYYGGRCIQNSGQSWNKMLIPYSERADSLPPLLTVSYAECEAYAGSIGKITTFELYDSDTDHPKGCYKTENDEIKYGDADGTWNCGGAGRNCIERVKMETYIQDNGKLPLTTMSEGECEAYAFDNMYDFEGAAGSSQPLGCLRDGAKVYYNTENSSTVCGGTYDCVQPLVYIHGPNPSEKPDVSMTYDECENYAYSVGQTMTTIPTNGSHPEGCFTEQSWATATYGKWLIKYGGNSTAPSGKYNCYGNMRCIQKYKCELGEYFDVHKGCTPECVAGKRVDRDGAYTAYKGLYCENSNSGTCTDNTCFADLKDNCDKNKDCHGVGEKHTSAGSYYYPCNTGAQAIPAWMFSSYHVLEGYTFHQKSERTCTDCLAGTYSDVTNALTCDNCTGATFSNAPGAASCTPWTVTPASCTNDADHGNERYTPGDSANDAQCTSCGGGGSMAPKSTEPSIATDCDLCDKGYGGVNNVCVPCTAGSTFNDVIGSYYGTPCAPQECIKGQGVTNGTLNDNTGHACEVCEKEGIYEQYSDRDDTGQCQTCTGNKFAADALGNFAASGAVACLNCTAGKHQDTPAGECEECSIGYSSVEGGHCIVCGTGSNENKQAQVSDSVGDAFKDGTGATYCVDCPAGYGNTDGGQCDKCLDGFHSASAGAACTQCGLNNFTADAGGFYVEKGATQCLTCPANSGKAAGAGKCSCDSGYELTTPDGCSGDMCGSCQKKGCMTQGYDNYDALAVISDTCTKAGCMTQGYDNYDALATSDDGSCSCASVNAEFVSDDCTCKTGYSGANCDACASGYVAKTGILGEVIGCEAQAPTTTEAPTPAPTPAPTQAPACTIQVVDDGTTPGTINPNDSNYIDEDACKAHQESEGAAWSGDPQMDTLPQGCIYSHVWGGNYWYNTAASTVPCKTPGWTDRSCIQKDCPSAAADSCRGAVCIDNTKREAAGMSKAKTDAAIQDFAKPVANKAKIVISPSNSVRDVEAGTVDTPQKQRSRLKMMTRTVFKESANANVKEYRIDKAAIPTGIFKKESKIQEVSVLATNTTTPHVIATITDDNPKYAPMEKGDVMNAEIKGGNYQFEQKEEDETKITFPDTSTQTLNAGETVAKNGLLFTAGSIIIENGGAACDGFGGIYRSCPDILNSYNSNGCCGGATGQCATDVLEYNCAACCS